ncbi:MAG: RloB domain-containing protein [Crocinitomicaceae bacterium]|nr:RloB domain-containing protein [Crocinitomicaceae bacterium]
MQMIKRNERQIKVDIKPEIPQKKKLSDQYSKVIELSKSYDKVYWVIDLDVILSESLLVKKGNTKAIDALTQYKGVIENKHKNVIVVINQPCLEFWFLIHSNSKSLPAFDKENLNKGVSEMFKLFEDIGLN